MEHKEFEALEDRIRARAHHIWEREGCPDGRAERDDWRQETTTDMDVPEATEHTLADLLYDEVRRRAYALWEAEGRPEGRNHEHWLAAEREVMREHGIHAAAPQPSPDRPAKKQ